MKEKYTLLFKINYLKESSIPIEIIDRIAEYFTDRVDIYVLVLFSTPNFSNRELPIDGKNLTIVHGNICNHWDLLQSLPELLDLIREVDPDIIHTNHKYSSWLLGYRLFDPNTKFVHTIHSDFANYDLFDALDSLPIFVLYDSIIYNSKNTQNSCPDKYRLFGPDNEYIIYNGINRNLLNSNKKQNISNSDTHILSAGRFVEEKNFELALNAIGKLVESGQKNIQFTLVGDGPLENEYIQIVSEQNLESYVTLPGFISREEVYQKMWNADIYLVTSLYEGFCNAAVEAMFCENILVSSNIEPLKSEVIGPYGVYFENDNLNSLVETLKTVVDNVEKYTNNRNNLAERAQMKFDLNTTAQKYTEVYENLA